MAIKQLILNKGNPKLSLNSISEMELLETKIKDLPLRWDQTFLLDCIRRLFSELEAKGFRYFPTIWFSDDWFCPDNVFGFAVPFYLAHERLMKLEDKQMFEIEGGTEKSCMKILRHEAAHAYDNLYKIHKRVSWRKNFGNPKKVYPKSYKPEPNSRDFVTHLDNWYAQAHPSEDYAETFAVWLNPNSKWQKTYKDWPAINKILYLDKLVKIITNKKAQKVNRTLVDPVSSLTKTLGQHYRERKKYYSEYSPDFYDIHLKKLFSDDPKYLTKKTAAEFIRVYRKDLREPVSNWTGINQYTIDVLLDEIIERSKKLKLRCTKNDIQTKAEMLLMLSVVSMNFIHSGNCRILL